MKILERKILFLFLSTSLMITGCISQTPVRSRTSFNASWKFARFGEMPDGSVRFEPGGTVPNYHVYASSEAMERDGQASHIIDGDPNTFWNSAAAENQFVAVEFRQPKRISGLYVTWGFGGAPGIVVETKNREGEWKQRLNLTDNEKPGSLRVRFPQVIETDGVKIKLVKMPKGGWPRIGELVLYDPSGKPVKFDMRKDPRPAPYTVGYNDSSWRKVTIPHDWAIEGPFDVNLDSATGQLPWKGLGWYRRRFHIPASDRGKKVYIDFDGAMANSAVYVNGKYAGGWPYGYNSFRVDITPYLNFGKDNEIAVRLDTAHWGSRWYPGAGIYRNVWLVKTEPVHVAHWGVAVITPQITEEKALAKFAVNVENTSPEKCDMDVLIDIADPQGKHIASGHTSVTLPGRSIKRIDLETEISAPELWDIKTPNLYKAVVRLKSGKRLVDKYSVAFGIRSLKFTDRDGFYLNGDKVQIKGVCNHHDLGPLGAAVNVRAMERQLEILKEMGCNAVRTSHNPPAPELLDLCDRMGFLVMDEAFDCWKRGKRPNDYSVLFDKWHKKDLEAMVKRDRNHPSVIMWSIGNEVPDQHNAEMAKMLRDIVHNTDPTRPVCLGSNDGRVALSPVVLSLDIMGLNYNLGAYNNFFNRKENKNTPLIASETSSCVSSRGEYFFPVNSNRRSNFQVTSYDIDNPGWGCTPDKQFEMLEKFPAVLGEFVWTGFDYIGEPTPYNQDMTNLLNFSDPAKRAAMKKELERIGTIKPPARSSYFGIVDLVGLKKDRFYLYQAHWRPDLPMAHILPHWNWPERIGKETPVHVYTSGDEAELFLNAKSLGRKKKGKYEYRLRWDNVRYQPGTLKVIAYKNGKRWAEDIVRTTGKPAKLAMTADRTVINADGKDLSFVTVSVTDKQGLTVPRTHNLIRFRLKGPGRIAAIGSGDPTSHELFQNTEHRVFNGKCVVLIESGSPGAVILEAESDGLEPGSLMIHAGDR